MGNKKISEYGQETQFKRGNPGKPKGAISITGKIKQLCAEQRKLKNSENGKMETKTIAEWIAISLIKESLKGNIRAIEKMLEYTDGKPAQTNIHVGSDGQAMQHEVKLSRTAEEIQIRVAELINNK